jgi:hypothetical protein
LRGEGVKKCYGEKKERKPENENITATRKMQISSRCQGMFLILSTHCIRICAVLKMCCTMVIKSMQGTL